MGEIVLEHGRGQFDQTKPINRNLVTGRLVSYSRSKRQVRKHQPRRTFALKEEKGKK